MIGEISATDATAIATVVLAVVTLFYVVLVYLQLSELRQQRAADADRWREERVRNRSENAARLALEAIYASHIRPGEGSPDEVSAASHEVRRSLEQNAPLVSDPELGGRMRATVTLLWMMGWNREGLANDGVGQGMLSLKVREIVERCSHSLQCHLTGIALPAWSDFPSDNNTAQAWVYENCRAPGGL